MPASARSSPMIPQLNQHIKVNILEADSIPSLTRIVLDATESVQSEGFLWFRGHSCNTFRLLPKLMREGMASNQVFDREKRLLTRFRQRSMAYWPDGYPQNNWEHLFAMQHYGLPTRLLDWSENLFVAAFFALQNANTQQHHSHEGTCVPEIWCMNPVQWNRSLPALSQYGESIRVLTTVDEDLNGYSPDTPNRRAKMPVAIFGAHNSQRIVAQRGTFMVWGERTEPLESLAEEVPGSHLWRIRLTGDRQALFEELQALGFSETMIFPELPSLAVELGRTEGWK